jgi:hypothetical protein
MKQSYFQSGKVGNRVWQRNRYGPICYERFIPANPRTARQVAVRSQFGAVSAHWRWLSEEQRALWQAAGRQQRSRRRMGQSGPLSGYNYFVQVNMLRAHQGESLVEVPPPRAQRSPGTAAAPEMEANGSERRGYGVATVAVRYCNGILSAPERGWRRAGRVSGAGEEVVGAGPGACASTS